MRRRCAGNSCSRVGRLLAMVLLSAVVAGPALASPSTDRPAPVLAQAAAPASRAVQQKDRSVRIRILFIFIIAAVLVVVFINSSNNT